MTDVVARLAAALAERYKLERQIGEGGMATVYVAEDLKHKRKVAVKVLRLELAAMFGTERFLNEIQVTANVQHPHILPLFDSGEKRIGKRQGHLRRIHLMSTEPLEHAHSASSRLHAQSETLRAERYVFTWGWRISCAGP